MDNIRIGLDFGTHQTKICIQRIPDEGHGEPNYEFFKFTDLQGKAQYFLPSVVQINKDDTLSYGFVDKTKKKPEPDKPQMPKLELEDEFDIADLADQLYDKYATSDNQPEDMYLLGEMLKIRLQNIQQRNTKKRNDAEKQYQVQLQSQSVVKNVCRYFKQATFIGEGWSTSSIISSRNLCILYLAYLIFLLEEDFGTNFSINIGVPADDSTYEAKKRLAVEILAASYYLVEDVYKNDVESFLNEKYEILLDKILNRSFTNELKEFYVINVFPEAYASLFSLTKRGKLPENQMSLAADIGGGTTDVSFFSIKDGLPMIYKYWSIPRGLNYVAKESGFDYADGKFVSMVHQDVIDKYNRKKDEIIYNLVVDLRKRIVQETSIPVQNLIDALKDKVVVYSGGGSTFDFLTDEIYTFTDVRIIDASVWKEENIIEKYVVSDLSILLTTAYGLSMCKTDEEVELKSYSSLFEALPKKDEYEIPEISKDQC